MERILVLDLDKKQYDEDILIKNLHSLSLRQIIKTQKLSKEFVENYLLVDDYKFSDEDYYIDLEYVIRYQKHLLYTDFTN